jgi:excisionase family DNA binding protein
MERLAVPPADAARAVGLSRAALYPRLMSGEIKSVLVGRRRLVPVDELRRWLGRQMEGASQPATDWAQAGHSGHPPQSGAR